MKKLFIVLLSALGFSAYAQVELVSTGSANTYLLAFPGVFSYTNGVSVTFKANFSNTAAAAIDINGLGQRDIRKQASAPLAANDILDGQVVTLVYDGNNFQMTSAGGNAGGGGTLTGDVTGNTGSNTVEKIRGVNVAATPPATNQVLQYNGSNWVPATLGGGGGNPAWELGGNAGTDPAVNFIGTTDDAPLVFRTLGDTTNQMVLSQNGSLSLGMNGVFIGWGAGNAISEGGWGSSTAIGYNAHGNMLGGGSNTAIGAEALRWNYDAYNNTAIGIAALYDNYNGNCNTAIGQDAAKSTNGDFNTAIGYKAMDDGSSGSDNTAIGSLTKTTGNKSTAIGYRAVAEGDNSMVLGSIAGVNSATANTNVGIGTTTPLQRLHVKGQVRIDTVLSANAADSILTIDATGVVRKRTAGSLAGAGSNQSLSYNVSTHELSISDGNTVSLANLSCDSCGGGEGGNAQTLSMSGDTVFISDGNYIVLPYGGTILPPDTSGATGGDACSDGFTTTYCEGTIEDGSGGGNYANDLFCTWIIAPENAASVSVVFTAFDVHSSEAVTIYDGWNLLGSFTGNTIPDTIISNDGIIYIEFMTDGSETAGGWSLNYFCLPAIPVATAWKVGGNEGTMPNNHFIGTTDGQPLNFRTNNEPRMKLRLDGGLELYGNNQNTYIGNGAGADAQGGSYNIGIGNYALFNSRFGSNQIAIGNQALHNFTGDANNHPQNIAIGTDALYNYNVNIEYGGNGNNIAIGNQSMLNLGGDSSKENIGIGNGAMKNMTSGFTNTVVGHYAMLWATGGKENSVLGAWAMEYNTSGYRNVAIGANALWGNEDGSHNTAVGSGALVDNVTGSYNTAIGYQAGVFSDNLENATAIGYDAHVGISNAMVLGNNDVNVGIGTSEPDAKLHIFTSTEGMGFRLMDGSEGQDKVLVSDVNGYAHWEDAPSGGDSTGGNSWKVKGNTVSDSTATFIGTKNDFPLMFRVNNIDKMKLRQNGALELAGDNFNTMIGESVRGLAQSGMNNVAVGYASMFYANGANENIAIGYFALGESTGDRNVAVGNAALYGNTSGADNTAIGVNALNHNTSGNENMAIGTSSMYTNTTGTRNVGLGIATLYHNTFGTNNTATGYYALNKNTSANNNTADGYYALYNNTTGESNTAMGSSALFSNTQGYGNTGIGIAALTANTTGALNTALGAEALNSNTLGGANTAIGVGALKFNIGNGGFGTGSNNVAIGGNALITNTNGSYNTGLGTQSDVASNSLTNATAVGAFAEVSADNSVVIGSINGINGAPATAKVGIGVSAPAASLHVSGTLKLDVGTPGAGKVLTSDASGNATWEDAAGGGGSDDQTLTYSNDTLYISNGNSVVIAGGGAGIPDTTGEITGDACSGGQTLTYCNGSFETNHPAYAPLDCSWLIQPNSGLPITLTFNMFNTYSYADTVYIYDGSSDADPLLVGIAGFHPGYTITAPGGSMYVRFVADVGGYPGFEASYSCGNLATSWLLGGNTNTAGKFIGTLDDQPLRFKTANEEKMQLRRDGVLELDGFSRGVTALGVGALSHYHASDDASEALVAIGARALENLTGGATTESMNTAVGGQSLRNLIEGGENTALGYLSLSSVTEANANTAIGAYAMRDATGGNNNVAVGYATLVLNSTGQYNTAIGAYTLELNTEGYDNTGIGAGSLHNNTDGSRNVGLGNGSLYTNSTGSANVAMGYEALYYNVAGSNMVAIGDSALFSNTNGFDNTAIGSKALFANESGAQNTALGIHALWQNLGGTGNTSTGAYALNGNTSGANNTAFGYNALFANSTGSNNTAIGFQADVSANNLTNATAIGANASVNASNKIRLGDAAVTIIEGQVAFTSPSDGRFKEDVKEDVKGLDFILKLRPVTYIFNRNKYSRFIGEAHHDNHINNTRQTGFIAQEMEKAVKETGYDGFDGVNAPADDKGTYGVSYSTVVVPLVKAVQELNHKVDVLEKEIIALKSSNPLVEQEVKIPVPSNEELQKQIDELKKIVELMQENKK